jgi:hypothetical protein
LNRAVTWDDVVGVGPTRVADFCAQCQEAAGSFGTMVSCRALMHLACTSGTHINLRYDFIASKLGTVGAFSHQVLDMLLLR